MFISPVNSSLAAQSYRPVLPPSLTAQSYGDIERRQREVMKSQNGSAVERRSNRAFSIQIPIHHKKLI